MYIWSKVLSLQNTTLQANKILLYTRIVSLGAVKGHIFKFFFFFWLYLFFMAVSIDDNHRFRTEYNLSTRIYFNTFSSLSPYEKKRKQKTWRLNQARSWGQGVEPLWRKYELNFLIYVKIYHNLKHEADKWTNFKNLNCKIIIVSFLIIRPIYFFHPGMS